MATQTLSSGFSSADAARILHIPSQQISAWQRAGLLRKQEGRYSVRDLATMRRLRTLSGARPISRSARLWAEALRSCLREESTDGTASTLPDGARLLVRHRGALLDPLTQQLAFDFCVDADNGVVGSRKAEPVSMDAAPKQASAATETEDFAFAQELFQQAVMLEERPGHMAAAAEMYREVLRVWPAHAPASVNLGTILYNQQRFGEAEERYRTAAEIDPDYALAFFDLGNVLDELQRVPEAIAAYLRALQLVPQYADAHYNLALAYERLGERRRALRHWMSYVRLDPAGPWAAHARMQAKKALSSEKLRVVSRFGKLAG